MISPRDKWIRVSKRNPCPICGRSDWCLLSADGEAVICARVESAHRCGDAGWLHRLADPVAPPPPPKPQTVTHSAVEEYLRMPALTIAQMRQMSEGLGLSGISLNRMGIRWSFEHHAAAFPMRDSVGIIIGARLRADNGRKFAVTGSRAGLFIPDGEVPDLLTELWICEGPTDCAAVLDLGIYAVGRPSCSGGTALLIPIAARRDVVILADADEPKMLPGGKEWRPGKQGAENLADALLANAGAVKIVYPLSGKDVRDWLKRGLTGDVLRVIAANTESYENLRKRRNAPSFLPS